MNITVIGCGRWGSFIAWYLDKIGHQVTLYGRSTSKHMKEFLETRSNGLLTLQESVQLSVELSDLDSAEIIVISINSQGLERLMADIGQRNLVNKTFVLCMKGIEIGTGRRLTEIAAQGLDDSNHIAVWLGPGHVQEYLRDIPNCMVIDSEEKQVKERLIREFSGELIRFYYGQDLIGNEIGAAAKNVIGIAAGMLDGLNLTTLKGALMSRGTREIARLIKAMGGNELSAYGLCHLGDYQATVFSEFSHNRGFGESFVKGEVFTDLAEGYYTVKALIELGERYQVDLPICKAVFAVLYEKKDTKTILEQLFSRDLKNEF
ncbi:NAD(P)H-dependent glycerol-3-phosphate dehydrogenase [Anaerocolumna sp. AGMB13020]|uniref:NAD(P)H-dependent glycerol-3-phosphate dehydrogenase n=1 Tax=Anaerocolumna sp. AGMB13020 TaxID=3081750 RepID=UPI0029536BAD|nr:NAD(P)H-dependent glycerol-3-phosphate dehydrogenase [Anaerocolumna sp. AGMB13020]WOO37490.1 NAD(P)H-dependent glycerol-3-phosphate dehydrogenase [Anaerocolumna sp. AGMB13020]